MRADDFGCLGHVIVTLRLNLIAEQAVRFRSLLPRLFWNISLRVPISICADELVWFGYVIVSPRLNTIAKQDVSFH